MNTNIGHVTTFGSLMAQVYTREKANREEQRLITKCLTQTLPPVLQRPKSCSENLIPTVSESKMKLQIKRYGGG